MRTNRCDSAPQREQTPWHAIPAGGVGCIEEGKRGWLNVQRRKLRSSSTCPYLAPAPPTTTKILPIQLRVGDRLKDETGEWQVVGRPYTTAGGKTSHVRVQRVDKPGVTETRLRGSYEKVMVIRRASAEEGKR